MRFIGSGDEESVMENEKRPPTSDQKKDNVIVLHINDHGEVRFEIMTRQVFSDRVSDDEETGTSYYGANVKFASSFEQLTNNPAHNGTMLLVIKGEIVIPRLKKKFDID
jgi:hypothetical protein